MIANLLVCTWTKRSFNLLFEYVKENYLIFFFFFFANVIVLLKMANL